MGNIFSLSLSLPLSPSFPTTHPTIPPPQHPPNLPSLSTHHHLHQQAFPTGRQARLHLRREKGKIPRVLELARKIPFSRSLRRRHWPDHRGGPGARSISDFGNRGGIRSRQTHEDLRMGEEVSGGNGRVRGSERPGSSAARETPPGNDQQSATGQWNASTIAELSYVLSYVLR